MQLARRTFDLPYQDLYALRKRYLRLQVDLVCASHEVLNLPSRQPYQVPTDPQQQERLLSECSHDIIVSYQLLPVVHVVDE